ncbi:MAG: hypothetical protein ACKESB_00275 [Candidatus Hodgkinia cicadicola]
MLANGDELVIESVVVTQWGVRKGGGGKRCKSFKLTQMLYSLLRDLSKLL